MTAFLDAISGLLRSVLVVLEGFLEPIVTQQYAWGFAIVGVTVLVRVIMIPLAVKQINSTRAMQRIQPEVKKIQAKYKVDRSLMRTDPEKYQRKRQQQQEALMALYKEEQVNPASGCLPLIVQMPIFLGLFRLLSSDTLLPELSDFGWFGINNLTAQLSQGLGAVGWGALVLAAGMAATTYFTQRQSMRANPGVEVNQQQKILLYVMPIMLLVFSFNVPVGVLIYWVTTNLWTMGQQFVMFRNVEPVT